MPDLLSQRAVHERLPQGTRCSGSRNTYAEGRNVPDDEAGNKEIYEVEDQMVDSIGEFLRVGLADGKIVE